MIDRAIRPGLIAGLMLLTACPEQKPPPPPKPEAVYDSIDALQAALAERARQKLGFNTDEYRLLITEVGFPAGTLVAPDTARVESWDACAPKPGELRPPAAVPSLFPGYTVNNKVAGVFGLDAGAVSRLASAKVDVESSDTATLSFRGVEASYLANDQLKRLLAEPACAAALSAGELYLVRGEIRGQRRLLLSRALRGSGSVAVTQIGNVSVTPVDGRAEVSIDDEAPTQFLQIVSLIKPAPAAPKPVPAPGPEPAIQTGTPVVIASVRPPLTTSRPATGQTRVYLQRDVADKSGTANSIADTLRRAGFDVVKGIEAIPSDRVPGTAQVRYFNEADSAAAEAALARLKDRFPASVVKRVGLPAPAGQIEIWLPDAARVAATAPAARPGG
jgi:hypothetical protein